MECREKAVERATVRWIRSVTDHHASPVGAHGEVNGETVSSSHVTLVLLLAAH
jgi:hypothetical protein